MFGIIAIVLVIIPAAHATIIVMVIATTMTVIITPIVIATAIIAAVVAATVVATAIIATIITAIVIRPGDGDGKRPDLHPRKRQMQQGDKRQQDHDVPEQIH